MTPEQYNRFIKNGLFVGFTDDQIDFLQRWLEPLYVGYNFMAKEAPDLNRDK